MEQEQQRSPSFSGMLGRALLLPLRAIAYVLNPLNCCNSSDKIKRDARCALREVVDGRPYISLHAEMSKDSDKLGMQFVIDKSGKFQSGYVAVAIPERLSGKIHKVKQKKIDGLQNEHPNIEVNPKNKMVLIEIDTQDIQKDLDPKKNKTFIRGKIAKEIHSNLKALMKMTDGGGNRVPYNDWQLINSIAKLLYDSHNYTRSEEKVLSVSTDRSIVVCIANKGVISLGRCSQAQNYGKAGPSNPSGNMSDIELNNLCIKQI